jgi:hypothetical protein
MFKTSVGAGAASSYTVLSGILKWKQRNDETKLCPPMTATLRGMLVENVKKVKIQPTLMWRPAVSGHFLSIEHMAQYFYF